MASQIELYTQPGCPPCTQAKQFFEEQGVDFVMYDVTQDHEALDRLLNELGSRSTPTIVVDGEVILGFDRERIMALLQA